MFKILFLHGFYASGQCVPALALKEAFEGRAEVVSPDLPLHPNEALSFIRSVIDREQPDVLVGNSCGSFYAQMLVPVVGLPALLGNPHFKMTEFLQPRLGDQQYKSPRSNGNQHFVITEQLIDEFSELESHQFDAYNPKFKDNVYGMFGEHDTLAHFEPLFRQYYTHALHFPGAHTPTAEEVHKYYAPAIEQLYTLVMR